MECGGEKSRAGGWYHGTRGVSIVAQLSEKKRRKILADWGLEGSYRAAAKKNNVSPSTVRRIVLADPVSAAAARDKKTCARDILSYMDGKRDTVCQIIGNGLEVLADPERMQEAKLRDIATMLGILVDKWAMVDAARGGNAGVQVELGPELEEYSG